ncbi:MAG: hypothetical protein OEM19_02615 [Deltaproteobacteria bacterium]|nr:hypothetical protein [Deltaproteobacteria bacterium]
MNDFIKGIVTNVIDGKTIEMDVTQIGRKNFFDYNKKEKVHVLGIRPFLYVINNHHSWKSLIEKILLGKGVTCVVNSRNADGEIAGEVFLL